MTREGQGEYMDLALLGWPPDGPQLRLDHERFSYAGKFVMTQTGKAVAREDDEIVAAVAFSEDRTDPGNLWIRYVTVRDDRRGDGIAPELRAFVVARARDRGYDRVTIGVNNPFSYQALYRAGFAYTGDRTGLAELVLSTDADRSRERYHAGLEEFAGRDHLSDREREFVGAKRDQEPPESIDAE